jgi:hypothetical protein
MLVLRKLRICFFAPETSFMEESTLVSKEIFVPVQIYDITLVLVLLFNNCLVINLSAIFHFCRWCLQNAPGITLHSKTQETPSQVNADAVELLQCQLN